MKEFVEFLKLPPSILTAVAIGSGLVLFLPNTILLKLGLSEIPQIWKITIGIVFVVSMALLSTYFLTIIIKRISRFIKWLYFRVQFPKTMKNLRVEERKIACVLYLSPNFTSYLASSDGITSRLVSKLIIQTASASSIAIGDKMHVPYTITPIAQRYIDKHPKFIEEFEQSDLQKLYAHLNDHWQMY